MIKKCKKSLDSVHQSGVLFTDLSNAFDFIYDELLLAKLYTYYVDKNCLHFISSYLSQRKRITKIKTSYSTFADIVYSGHESSFLGPLLFNIYVVTFFYDADCLEIANYVDGITLYNYSSNLSNILEKFEKVTEHIFKWFVKNCQRQTQKNVI